MVMMAEQAVAVLEQIADDQHVHRQQDANAGFGMREQCVRLGLTV